MNLITNVQKSFFFKEEKKIDLQYGSVRFDTVIERIFVSKSNSYQQDLAINEITVLIGIFFCFVEENLVIEKDFDESF